MCAHLYILNIYIASTYLIYIYIYIYIYVCVCARVCIYPKYINIYIQHLPILNIYICLRASAYLKYIYIYIYVCVWCARSRVRALTAWVCFIPHYFKIYIYFIVKVNFINLMSNVFDHARLYGAITFIIFSQPKSYLFFPSIIICSSIDKRKFLFI